MGWNANKTIYTAPRGRGGRAPRLGIPNNVVQTRLQAGRVFNRQFAAGRAYTGPNRRRLANRDRFNVTSMNTAPYNLRGHRNWIRLFRAARRRGMENRIRR